jgi:hypothetical protein
MILLRAESLLYYKEVFSSLFPWLEAVHAKVLTHTVTNKITKSDFMQGYPQMVPYREEKEEDTRIIIEEKLSNYGDIQREFESLKSLYIGISEESFDLALARGYLL